MIAWRYCVTLYFVACSDKVQGLQDWVANWTQCGNHCSSVGGCSMSSGEICMHCLACGTLHCAWGCCPDCLFVCSVWAALLLSRMPTKASTSLPVFEHQPACPHCNSSKWAQHQHPIFLQPLRGNSTCFHHINTIRIFRLKTPINPHLTCAFQLIVEHLDHTYSNTHSETFNEPAPTSKYSSH